jgi:hypothetical protein
MKNEWMSLEAIVIWIMFFANPCIALAAYIADNGATDIMSLVGMYCLFFMVSLPCYFLFFPLAVAEVVIFYCVAGVFRQFLKLARGHH